MRIRTTAIALAALLSMATLCPAQGLFDFGDSGANAPAWSSFKLPKTKIKLDFPNSSIDMVLGLLSKTSGITIVKDPALTGTISITTPNAVSLSEAFAVLNTTLGLKNYEIAKQGNLLVVRPRQQRQMGGSTTPSFDADAFRRMLEAGQPQLKVYPITYANASQVARVINDVFATTPSTTDQLMQFLQGGTIGAAPAAPQGGRNNGRQGRFGGGGFQFGGRGGAAAGGSTVRASSDDYSNSVIVNAPGSSQQQVEDLIRKLDRQTEEPQKTRTFKLNYASSDDLVSVVQNVLTANVPRGRGGATSGLTSQQTNPFARIGLNQLAAGQVVSDPRTNALVVTATDENLKIVDSLLKDLDTEIKIENTTFVMPLQNAQATEVASLLQQAFGTRQGVNGARPNTNTNQNRTNTNNRNNNTGNRNNNNGGGGAGRGLQGNVVDDGKNLELALDGNDGEDNELATTVSVVQGGGFNFGQQQRRPTGTSTTQTGRNDQGQLVNVRDLTNQVTVIPDPNTNSLIIVTTPDNAELIRQILEQLDRIPEQVMIETLIVEATLDAEDKFGVEWNLAQSNILGNKGTTSNAGGSFGLQNANPALQGFRYTLAGGDLSAFVNALKTDTKFQVLSTPRIFTSNNVQGQINISQSIPYILSTREDANGNLTNNYTFQDVGIVLTVTPHISTNGYVTMDVNQTANDLQGFTDFNAPIVNQRTATTTVSIKDGETVILGGIIRNNVTSTVKKIPILGDIPVLGNLFKSTDRTKSKTELLVFLTPHLVRDADESRRLREQQQKDLSKETQKAVNDHLQKVKDDKKTVPPPGGGN